MAPAIKTPFLCSSIGFFVVVSFWLALSWLRIARLLALANNRMVNNELPLRVVLDAVVEKRMWLAESPEK